MNTVTYRELITKRAPWTLCLGLAMCALNLGIIASAPDVARELVGVLEFDRRAISSGDVWRLFTGSLVHWTPYHFLLDVGTFLIVGLIFERQLGRLYPWMLLASGLAVGASVFLLESDLVFYRGLSGVVSGQFTVGIFNEILRARNRRQVFLLLPALSVLTVKLIYESATGTMMFATERLGDLGDPLPLAHVAGTLGALAAGFVWIVARSDGDIFSPNLRARRGSAST